MTERDWEGLEVDLLIRAVFERYGYDFREYSPASLRRRIKAVLIKQNVRKVSELTEKVIHDPDAFSALLVHLTVTVTELFRDPLFFRSLRENIVPYLQTFSELKVWHPGCATGEEVYSMAILLTEAGLYERSLIYATDINVNALTKAREGIIAEKALSEAQGRYKESGGLFNLSKYFTTEYRAAIADRSLKRHLVFSDHNLVTDGKFGEMNLILCRNVLIYFSPPLQRRVLQLLWDSLAIGGFLCLGMKERLDSQRDLPGCYLYSKADRIYQKKV